MDSRIARALEVEAAQKTAQALAELAKQFEAQTAKLNEMQADMEVLSDQVSTLDGLVRKLLTEHPTRKPGA